MRHEFNWRIASAIHTDELMQAEPTLQFTVTYPLRNPFHFSETHADGSGWTQRQFMDAVQRAYVAIYEAEGPDPGQCSDVLLNRAETSGPYGIWGHDLDDLYLEGAARNSDGSWTLYIGS